MFRRATIAVAILAVVALVGTLLAPVTIVSVQTDDGVTLVCRRVSPASTIALIFTHSMYGGDVTETYAPHGGALIRTGIVTDNAAAAEYYAWDGAVRAVDDGYDVVASPLEVESLPVRVDQVGDHRLAVDGTGYSLAGMVDGSARVWVEITSQPLVTQILGTRC